MPKRYWVMKCEPAAYTIERLEQDGETSWEGVRNYQARNFMREMKVGDGVLFYASNADPSGVSGVARVTREAYPDPFQFKKDHDYYDGDSNPDDPRWSSVNIGFVKKFPRVISLRELQQVKELADMPVLRKGNRLSVTPCTKEEFETVVKMGKAGA